MLILLLDLKKTLITPKETEKVKEDGSKVERVNVMSTQNRGPTLLPSDYFFGFPPLGQINLQRRRSTSL
ncbi:MAG: hypothetical protein PUP91_37890 [Rhizonema sp. PD37]|nr:hypothetical protein [Rhizonema sp. PD37]